MKEIFPYSFAVVFDGWSTEGMHYVERFATYPSRNAIRCETRFLAIAPMEDETPQNAKEHYEFLSFVLSVFNRNMTSVVALTGGKTSTNHAFSITAGISFCGLPQPPLQCRVKGHTWKTAKEYWKSSVVNEGSFFLDTVSVVSSAHRTKTETVE